LKTISIATPCYNEEENVEQVYNQVREVMLGLAIYKYEHIFIDNHSTDRTVEILKEIARRDTNVKIIVNARNFGQIRSPWYAITQAKGDAVIGIVADLQDPPQMIADFVREWEKGYPMVLAIKNTSDENALIFWLRKKYYRLVKQISSLDVLENCTGYGLYDRRVIDLLISFDEPQPYVRGLVAEIGLPYKLLYYNQPLRARGITKNNFYSLYDFAMVGITTMSKVPLRIATFLGFVTAAICMVIALLYLVYKLIFWNSFTVGLAPLIIGVFLLGSVQLIALGMLGEYIGAIHTHLQKRPYVVELERVNFDQEPGVPKSDCPEDAAT
jgi:glycosyltransferase involved in cell wall biosynthesis